ncbi:uncharacterized protein LOC126382159 [Pectinophora gossypiella]|uniref:uncharacterized protein LOC126382159 n=1 Tax=Pectinophora gossypiella TaxID=13191 RepID=UPI00214EF1DC|nr:uncharacterized protein LOC126382159 [Pectinophora gossypiella]
MRDQFVCGIRNENIRQRLFAEKNVTFDKAYQLAASMEAAEADAAAVEGRTNRVSDVTSTSSSSAVHMMAQHAARRERGSGSGVRGSGSVTHDAGRFSGGGGASASAGPGRQMSHNSRAFTTGANKHFNANKNRSKSECITCGGQHDAKTCKFQQYVCRICNRQGHLKRMCPNLRGGGPVYNITAEEEVVWPDAASEESDEFQIL